MPLINYFTSFPSLPVHLSFACRHLACHISLGLVYIAFKNNIENVLNKTQNLTSLPTDWG